jgi:hypothetical protein|tara:strand:+ start:11348 stop:11668 length:321 start_codon:yes stop_codon:yes gene_type:complete
MADRNNFKFVLRRYDRNPNLSIRVGGYEEVTNSVPIEMDGVVAATAFLNSENVFKRFVKLGWKDETQRYTSWLSEKTENQTSSQVVEFTVDEKPKKRGRKKKKETQ